VIPSRIARAARRGLLTALAAALLISTPAAQSALNDTRLTTPRDLDHPFTFTPAFQTKDEWLARRTALRQQILVATGLWPLPERTPLKPVIHGRVDRDGYTIENVFFASYPGHYVTGNLYRPKAAAIGTTGKRPAVLTPYGHWKEGRFFTKTDAEAQKQIELGADKTLESAKYPEQARCAMLARLGFIVFHYDLVGYADSKQIEHGTGFTDAEAELRLQSFMGLQTWNSLRALDFLTSLPDVDASRVAVTGASGGGTQTIILDAIDDRPAVAFPAVMVSGAMQGGCICENTWLLRVGTNNIEIAAAFAPKPMGMTGANDWTRDIMTLGLPELKKIYALFGPGAEDKVMARHFPFEHNYNQVSREVMYTWFNTQFALGRPSPVTERRWVPAPREELTVFDDAHPLPRDATDAAGLRAYLTRASDEQMTKLARDPQAYRDTVGTALRAMINDPLAKPGDVDVVENTLQQREGNGFKVHQALLTRQGSGEVLPALAVLPRDSAHPADDHTFTTIVIWAHPDGKRSLFQADGVTPVPAVRWLVDRKAMVISGDLFLTGEFQTPDKTTTRPRIKDQEKFAAYNDGYNRTVLANRVRDLLTLVAFAQSDRPTAIHLVAFDRSGVPALLARALAGDAITRASIDLAGYDFTQVHDADDEMMLPGALKYGGLLGFVPLTTTGATELYRPPSPAAPWVTSASLHTRATTLRNGTPQANQMVRWLLGQ
jgi:hypothetical protein